MMIFSLFYFVLNCMVYVYCGNVPSSPCPDIFQYIDDGNNEYHGLITIPYTDGGRYNITTGVGAWMPGYVPEVTTHHLQLRLITSQCDLMKNATNSIVYYVEFPVKHIIPFISIIAINEKTYCVGPPVPPSDGSSEFTTCGQTHYILFPQFNEYNQKSSDYYGEPPYGQEDQKFIQIAKPIVEDTPEIHHIDLPPYI